MDRSGSPLYKIFMPLYQHGWIAVDFFFSLSGFIFFWLYSERIAKGEVKAFGFAFLRFSRLYPLHFLTLVIVAIIQIRIFNVTGDYFVYENNDLYHFGLNFFFASSWGFEIGNSFNGPIWSVSIEIILYLTFFIICMKLPFNSYIALGVLVLSRLILQTFPTQIGRGVFSFFVGGAVYFLYLKTISWRDWEVMVKYFLFLTIALWLVSVGIIYIYDVKSLKSVFDGTFLSHNLSGFELKFANRIPALIVTGILFPLTIYTVCLVETKRGTLFKRVSLLGDWSYSIYLIHFPLQLLLILIFSEFNWNIAFFQTTQALVLFLSLLLLLSFASYSFYEKPMQIYLRKRFLLKTKK